MNIQQTNKLSMYHATLKTLQDHPHIWQTVQAFTEAVQELSSLISQIRSLGAQQVITTSGLTQSKAYKKERMARQAFTLANIALAYAARENNNELKTVLDFSLSQIHKSKDNISIDRCTAIHDQIQAILPALAAYSITAGDLAELQAAIAAFQQAIGDKGTRLSGSVASTQALIRLFEQADALLKDRLDKLVFRFQTAHPTFFDTYHNARSIKDLGKGRKTGKEKIKA